MAKLKKAITLFGMMIFLTQCSSKPSTEVTRDAYIKNVQVSLVNWENKAKKLSASQQVDLRAKTADARAELRRLESAPEHSWQNHKTLVDQRLNQIEAGYGSAD